MANGNETAVIVVVTVLTVLVLLFLNAGCKRVRHAEVMIIEHLGRYHSTLKPGLWWTWPIIQSARAINWRRLDVAFNRSDAVVKTYTTDRIDLREHVLDFGEQSVITRDTVRITVDALVYFRITDPRAAVFRVANITDAVELLAQATLRDIIASLTLDDTFSSRETINSLLLGKVQRDAERWGIAITRCEIYDIKPPRDIAEAMEKQIEAERERRSTVLLADGERESKIIRSRGEAAKVVLTAEGTRASAVLRARGEAEAKRLLAQADAASLAAMRSAVAPFGIRGVDYLAAVRYLNSLKMLTYNQAGTKVVLVPTDAVEGIEKIASLNPHISA